MGLGKTIEILSLILLHPHPQKQIFLNRFKERSHFTSEKDSCYYVTFISKKYNYQSEAIEYERILNDDDEEEIRCNCYCGNLDDVDDLIRCNKCGRNMHKSCGTIHEYVDDGKLCINCENNRSDSLLECHSTLIISPSSIRDQWISEIEKHFYPNTFKYIVYNGIEGDSSSTITISSISTRTDNKNKNKHGKYDLYSPRYLSQFDIVFTTYEVLQNEVYYHIDENPYASRSPKKYYSIISPLIRMKWWRVCLDEAQMVESTHSNVTLMALEIPTVNRWCVSGTPISQSLDDIFGLFVYLKVPIYNIKSAWDYCIKTPYEMNSIVAKHLLLDILYKLMWRTSKNQLPDNLLPPQISELLSLNFSPIERNFYNRQCDKCTYASTRLLNKLKNNSKNNNRISKNELLKAMIPLLNLRQACCHPQIGSNGLKTKSKMAMTMEEVLEKLIKDCQLDCEEYQRQYIASLNGLSALSQISNDRKDAINYYETILSLVKDNEKLIRADKLPIIHTKKNLSELLNHQDHICKIENNNSDNDQSSQYCGKCLLEEAKKVEDEYMFESNERVEKEYSDLNKCEKKIKEKGNIEKSIDWIIDVINDMRINNSYIFNTFLNECIEDLQTPTLTYQSLCSKILSHYSHLISVRKEVLNDVKQFNEYPSKEEVYETANCSTCKEGKNGKKCKHCFLYDKIDDYKLCLVDKRKETNRKKVSIFDSDSESDEDEENKNKHILHKDISLERENPLIVVYRRIERYINTFIEDENMKERMKKLLSQFDLFKEERLHVSHLWEAQHLRLGNIDELEMATLKIRLAYKGERVNDIDKSWILQPYELDQKYSELNQDRVSSLTLLKKNTGQLHYLLFLKSSYEKGETLNCVVCLQPMDLSNISMFPCGHAITSDCFKGLCKVANHERNIKCPVCKRLTRIADVYEVVAEKEKDNSNSIQSTITTTNTQESSSLLQQQLQQNTPRIVLPQIRGSYGTKIDAIVAKLIEIQNNQFLSKNIEKALVFSMWESVLDILEQALQKNNIPYYRISQKKKFGLLLKQFKNRPVFTVLLLSLKFGGKGLTIIEATHVLLVEPSLNPGVEEQAIGRIHRIGQTNTTYVHHFIINDSIEEKIKQLKETKSQNEKWKVSSSGSDVLSISELDDLYGSIKRRNYTGNDNSLIENENEKKRRKVRVNKTDLVSVENEIENDMDGDDENEDLNYWESRNNIDFDSRRNVLAYSECGEISNESILFHGLLLPVSVVEMFKANYS